MAKSVRPGSEAGSLDRKRSSEADIAAFLRRAQTLAPQRARGGRGRLIFAMDATMSRQPTWDLALSLQSEMFSAVQEVGGLDVQLIYFRGFGECKASQWVGDAASLARVMGKVYCAGGLTQIRKVLAHAKRQAAGDKVNALVYVGDSMEENIDQLSQRAGELGLLGLPVFIFQEGHDQGASLAFDEIARLSGGAHCQFDAGSAAQLRDLLKAVAVYASGGRKALEAFGDAAKSGAATMLLEQIG